MSTGAIAAFLDQKYDDGRWRSFGVSRMDGAVCAAKRMLKQQAETAAAVSEAAAALPPAALVTPAALTSPSP